MAFQQPGNAVAVNAGNELETVDTEVLGFASLGGDKKLKLLPEPWPETNLPPATATLLSVASRRGILAAAATQGLVIASTESVRKAFASQANEDGVITDFTPNFQIPIPQQLRHIAFSSNEDFFVISAESGGGLAIYDTNKLLQSNPQPEREISTDNVSVRSLVPNPAVEYETYFAAVLDNGRLVLYNASGAQNVSLRDSEVVCASWSTRGKQIVAGLADGSAAQYQPDGKLVCTIPAPPNLDGVYAVTGIWWLDNYSFFMVHSPVEEPADGEMPPEMLYHLVQCNKERTQFTYHKMAGEPIYAAFDGPKRTHPPRYSAQRLKNWGPDIEDMLVLAGSHCSDAVMLAKTSNSISPSQEAVGQWATIGTLDTRRAGLPTAVNAAHNDSVPIGEALDLSAREGMVRPIPTDEEIPVSPTPLPAYFMLSHQGYLSAYWIVYDRSIRNGTGYEGLIALRKDLPAAPELAPAQTTPAPAANATRSGSVFGQPQATFGAPSTPKSGPGGFASATPAFGQPSFGAGASTTPAFGKPSFGSSGFTKPAAQPSFGAPSSMGAARSGSATGAAFGAAGGLGNKSSVWGTPSQAGSQPGPQSQSNPFAAASNAPSAFSQLGTTGAKPFGGGSGSTTSSFGSFGGGQSSFANLGQKQTQTGFAGLSKPPAVSTEPSFGSTVTVGSGGSTLPSWAATPAQQGGSIFGGQGQSSFGSTKESDMSDVDDAKGRGRDEATPTPQPPPQPQGLFGAGSGSFKLGSTFKGDGSAKDDLPKSQASTGGSLFGNGFASALGSGSSFKSPATPMKKAEEQSKPQDVSTTPMAPPTTQPGSLFGSTTPAVPSQTPAKEPPKPTETPKSPEDSPGGNDAPLPPDFMTSKPSKPEDDLPPLAGSPAIQVEAPESDVPSSPLDDDGGDISVEEQEEEDATPPDTAQKPHPQKTGWTFTDSVNQSPRIPPAAPTPPVLKSGTSSRSRNQSRSPSRSPVRPPIPKALTTANAPSLFGQSATSAGFPKPNTIFPKPPNRIQDNLRSPSPQRSASTSQIGTRRTPAFPASGTPLASSIQQSSKPPTPQPEVSDLEDDEDAQIRELLASDIEPSRRLEPFIAHQDYIGEVAKPGIPGQIELMYRDINSMIDTLGLNARSLSAFLKYHEESHHQNGLSRSDLDDVVDQGDDGDWYDKWSFSEIEDLAALESELEHGLDNGRVQDVLPKLTQLARLQRDRAKLMTKINDIRRQIVNRKDAEKAEALRHADLPKEQSDLQKALRAKYAKLLQQLADAENAIAVLRSKLAGFNASQGKTKGVPSVEAVKKTINKLIGISEKKNNDIAVIENQLKKLGLNNSASPSRPNSSGRGIGTPNRSSLRRSRVGESPYQTPPRQKGGMSLSQLRQVARTPEDDSPGKAYGFFTPEGSPSRAGFDGRLVGEIDPKQREALKANAVRRKKAADVLADAIIKRGTRVTKFGD